MTPKIPFIATLFFLAACGIVGIPSFVGGPDAVVLPPLFRQERDELAVYGQKTYAPPGEDADPPRVLQKLGKIPVVPPGSGLRTKPVFQFGSCLVWQDAEFRLNAIDLEFGEKLWQSPALDGAVERICSDERRFIFLSTGKSPRTVRAVSLKNGALEWNSALQCRTDPDGLFSFDDCVVAYTSAAGGEIEFLTSGTGAGLKYTRGSGVSGSTTIFPGRRIALAEKTRNAPPRIDSPYLVPADRFEYSCLYSATALYATAADGSVPAFAIGAALFHDRTLPDDTDARRGERRFADLPFDDAELLKVEFDTGGIARAAVVRAEASKRFIPILLAHASDTIAVYKNVLRIDGAARHLLFTGDFGFALFDPAVAQVKWHGALPARSVGGRIVPAERIVAAAAAADAVGIMTDRRFIVVETATGRIRRSRSIPDAASALPFAFADDFFVLSASNELFHLPAKGFR